MKKLRVTHPSPTPANGAPLHPTVLDVGTQRVAKVYAEAILRAAKEGAAWGRGWERREDDKILEKLKAEGKIRIHPFADRAKLLKLAAPVKETFAKEIEADKVLAAITAVK